MTTAATATDININININTSTTTTASSQPIKIPMHYSAMSNINTPAMPAPPIAHAIGGSIGSTISMLLLYPLERVRIEMQAQAAHIRRQDSDSKDQDERDSDHDSEHDLNDFIQLDLQTDPDDQIHSISNSINDNINDIDYNDDEDNSYDYNDDHGNENSGTASKKNGPLQNTDQINIKTKRISTHHPTKSASNLQSSPALPSLHPTKANKALQQLQMLLQKSSIMRTIYKLHIQKTLYKGSTPIALTLALSNFIFFYTLQTLKKAFNQDRASFLTSTIAGVVNVLITNPFWVANLRLVQGESSNRNGNRNGDGSSSHNSISSDGNNIDSDDKKGIVDCFREIYEKEGLAQLWAGTGASLLLVSNPAIQYYCYESVKMELLKQRLHVSGAVPSLRPLEAFVIAALAKGLATVLTYPLQLSQLLMRLQKKERQMQLDGRGSIDNDGANDNSSPIRSDEKATGASAGGGRINRSQMAHQERQRDSDGRVYKGLFHCMTTLYKDGGMRALYSGMDAKLIQSVLTSALTFLTYEQILGVVARSYWSVSKRLSIGHTSF